MKLSLLTPEKKIVVDQEVEDVLVPAFKGELHILNGHAPLMTYLTTGIMKWRFKGETQYHRLVVSSGYCEISPDGVIVLAEHSTSSEEVVVDKFNEELKSLNSTLLTQHLDDKAWAETQRKVAALQSGIELKQKPATH
jgi:F-type H+-transporting ATPase subunit epsilon